MTAAEKAAAKKAEEEALKAAAPASADPSTGYKVKPVEPEEDLEVSDEELKRLQKRLLLSQLKTAEMQQDIALQAVEKHKTDTRTAEQRRDDAQSAILAQIDAVNRSKSICRHKQGGFGLEQTFRGDKGSTLVQMFLPIPGHRYITCGRCFGEWRNPQPSLKRTDPERYARELADFEKLWEQASDSNNQPIDVPRFSIERDGLPVHVDLR